jgi:hypothetical protein
MQQCPYLELWREACAGIREVGGYTPEEYAAYRNKARLIPPAFWLGDGRSVYTTQKSSDAMFTFAAQWRRESAERKARIQEKQVGQMALCVFGRFLAENGGVLWDDEAAALVTFKARLVESLEKASRDADHYFPCHVLTSNQASAFTVGQVRFARRDDWLAHVAKSASYDAVWVDAVKAHWADGTPLPAFDARAKMDAEEVIETIDRCQWIAVVHVKANELDQSGERARVATRLALDALGLVLPRDSALNLRGPGDPLDVVRTNRLSQFEGQHLNIGSHIDIPDLFRHPPHADAFMKSTEKLRADAGWAIEVMLGVTDDMELPELRQRWCDALYWFGSARREKSEFAALVLYGMCLDVLTNGGTADGITAMIASFSGGKASDALLTDGTSIEKVVERIYNHGRSRISHGTRPALLNDLPFPLPTADSVAQLALDRYLLYLRRYTGEDTAKAFLAAIPGLIATQKGLPPV